MQAAIARRKLSINLVAIVALVVALMAGGVGGYLLKSQLLSDSTTPGSETTVSQYQQPAPFHDMPDTVQIGQAAPFHDMPESR